MRRAAAALAVALLLAGCSTSDGPEPLSREQADQLAEVLVKNHDGGLADVRVSTVVGAGGGGLTMVGQVDWANGTGHTRILPAKADGVVDVYWDRASVWEYRPAVAARVTGSPDTVLYVRRPRDPSRRRLDQVIGVVDGLSSTVSDNSRIIRATEGSAFLRDDELDGTKVQVLRFGERSVYWLPASGEMLRFEGSNERGDQPVVVDVAKRTRNGSIEGPAQVVPVERIADLYASLAPTSP